MSDASHFRADEPTPASDARPTSHFSLIDPDAEPVVSIVTPFFNMGPLFSETATSVFRQTFKQWEWIIINDGSTDTDSLTVLDAYRSIDSRVSVVDLATNGGPGAARNAGFEVARGEYLMQLDNDDMLEPTALEKLFWFLETNPNFAFAKGYTVGFGVESYVWANGFHEGEAFLERNHADVLAMIRRSVALEVGGYDAGNREGLEDWEFWLACAAAGYWGGTIHEPLGWYRRRSSHADTWSNWDDGPKEAAFRDKLRRQFPELWNGGFPEPGGRSDDVARFRTARTAPVNRLSSENRSLLMIVPWFEVGGADRVNLDLIEGLSSRGWDVTAVSTLPGRNERECEFKSMTPDVFVMNRFLELEDRPEFVDYLIRSRNVDAVLITNSWFGYDLLPFLRAQHRDLPIIDLTHAHEEWNDGGFPRLSNMYAEQLDLTITGSAHVRDWMLDNGGGGNIHVWYTGIDASRFELARDRREGVRSEIGLTPETFCLLFVGRLSEEKQPQVLIRVVDQLEQRGFDVHAVLVGSGPQLDQLQAEVVARSLTSRISFEGTVSDSRVADLLAAADLFVLPSSREGIAVTVYEAMASGLPVVATDVGGQRELVIPETGVLLLDPVGHDIVVRISNEVADLISDPAVRATMGAAGRARVVEEFRADQAMDRFNGLLLEAIDLRTTQSDDSESVFDESELAMVLERHRAIETQQLYTLDQWQIQSQQPQQGSGESFQPTTTNSAYGLLARVLRYPYLRFKEKNPETAMAMRDRVRSLLRKTE